VQIYLAHSESSSCTESNPSQILHVIRCTSIIIFRSTVQNIQWLKEVLTQPLEVLLLTFSKERYKEARFHEKEAGYAPVAEWKQPVPVREKVVDREPPLSHASEA
jgi:hypothetical protein